MKQANQLIHTLKLRQQVPNRLIPRNRRMVQLQQEPHLPMRVNSRQPIPANRLMPQARNTDNRLNINHYNGNGFTVPIF